MPGRFVILPSALVSDRRIGDAGFRVLAALSTYADRDGWCWPSQTTLAADVSTSRRAVRRQLDLLEQTGYIEGRRRVHDDGSESSKMFRLLYDLDHRRATRQSPPAPDAPTTGTSRAGTGALRATNDPIRTIPLNEEEKKKRAPHRNHGPLEKVIHRE